MEKCNSKNAINCNYGLCKTQNLELIYAENVTVIVNNESLDTSLYKHINIRNSPDVMYLRICHYCKVKQEMWKSATQKMQLMITPIMEFVAK